MEFGFREIVEVEDFYWVVSYVFGVSYVWCCVEGYGFIV